MKDSEAQVLPKLAVEPWGQNILVKPDQADKEKKKGSIILPQGQTAPPNIGTVVAVGAGRKHGNGYREPMRIEPGWRVYYPPYNTQEIEVGGEKYIILDENNVLAIEISEPK